ncbi:Retrovirus-related Pol polyprotein from transposon RE1 [Vitis vinifera]|uniref:Retrovirus-related Pol polyprotein from transposon RE1 n=1 Tax=Vitis vinifera TaxID=29760 RepID=A0A438GUG0_VITVI|nr:Retrovirus-related Pol polyprotein from transposon RE1 [Vitis vinifera]
MKAQANQATTVVSTYSPSQALTPSQVQQLIALVLNTDATHHIFCTLETFISSTPVANSVVMLPNDRHRHKFSPCASPCIFLGYLPGYKGYKLLDFDSNTQFIFRDVVFHESEFPFHNTPSPSITHDILFSDRVPPALVSSSSPKISISSTSPSQLTDSTSSRTRIHYPPYYLQDYHCYSTIVESSSTSHPLSQVLSYHNLFSTHSTFIYALSSHIEPTSYSQVTNIMEWQTVMADDLRALESNKTRYVVSFPCGFRQSVSNSSLFIKKAGSSFLALHMYIDGIVLASSYQQEVDSLKHHYALELLSKAGYLGCKTRKTEMDPNLKLSQEDGDLLDYPFRYKRMSGKLLHLTITKPDLSYLVNRLNQFLANPLVPHLQVAYHVIKYIKSTVGQGSFFSIVSRVQLKAFAYVDWVDYLNTH